MSKKWFFQVIFWCFTQLLISCGGGGGSSNPVETEITLNSISINASATTVPVNFTQEFSAIGTYSDESTKDISTVVFWFSSNNTIATINSLGVAKGLSAGTVTITATSGDITTTGTLTVSSATVSSIEISPTPATVGIGSSQSFIATGFFSDETSNDISNFVTWSSNNINIATISTNGEVTGVSVGETIITASYGNVSESILLDVTLATLSSIAISPTASSIASGNIQIFSATGTYSDGSSQDLSSSVTWSSNNNAVATISSTGIATGVSEGSTTITATLGEKSGSTTLTITAATLNSIQVTPISATIVKNGSQTFVATGIYSNGSSQVISNLVNWSSSNSAIASVASNGEATGFTNGSVTITATTAGKSDTATLTVINSTFQAILPIITNNCNSCHGNPTSNSAPMSLTTYSEISFFADSISDRINRSSNSNQLMPQGGPKLSAADIIMIDSWIADGKLNN